MVIERTATQVATDGSPALPASADLSQGVESTIPGAPEPSGQGAPSLSTYRVHFAGAEVHVCATSAKGAVALVQQSPEYANEEPHRVERIDGFNVVNVSEQVPVHVPAADLTALAAAWVALAHGYRRRAEDANDPDGHVLNRAATVLESCATSVDNVVSYYRKDGE